MKKIILFAAIVVGMMSAASAQTVTVRMSGNQQVSIDGRFYNSSTSIPLSYGRHTVKLYNVRPGFIFSKRVLVSSSSFDLRNNNVTIYADQYGQLAINETGNGYGNYNSNAARDRRAMRRWRRLHRGNNDPYNPY